MPTAQPLTDRQQQVLDLCRREAAAGRSMPTRAEIADHFGWASPNSAETHIAALVRKGFLKLLRGKARGHAARTSL